MSTLLNHTIRRTGANKKLAASLVAATLLIFPLFGAATYAVDKSNKNDHAMHDMDKMSKTDKSAKAFQATDEVKIMAISDKARTALSPVYDLYFAVQKALAADEFDLAVKEYKQLDSSLTLVDMKLFKGEAHMKWMTFAERLAKQSKLGTGSKDIGAARKTFEALSLSVIEMERTFGHDGEREFYLTFCPMALGTGAYWMQTDKKVNNSYYGAKMLKCGSVKETFSSADMDSK